MAELQFSLGGLYASVSKLILLIQENADTLERKDEVLNKLPLLDFYNDDLFCHIQSLRHQLLD